MYFMISSANHGDGFDTLHFHIFVVLKECNKNTYYVLSTYNVFFSFNDAV